MKAIALDDEPLALNIIELYCKQTEGIVLERTFTKQSEAIKYLNKYPVDVLFLDIQMPKQNGIDFFKQLKNKPLVIFTTAYSEFAVEGFNVNAIDYLLKPFTLERFMQAVQKAKNESQWNKNLSERNYLFVRANFKLHKIDLEDIVLVEGFDDYVQIHLQNKSKIVSRQSMKSIHTKLPEKEFIRVHRSYIISIKKVKAVVHKNIQIEDFVIPIGETYKGAVASFLLDLPS